MCGSITEKLDSVCASSNGLMPPCKLPPEDAAVVGVCEASEGFKPVLLSQVGGCASACCSWRVRVNGPAASCQPGGIMAGMPRCRMCTGELSTAAVAWRERSCGTALPARWLTKSPLHQRSIDRANECCGSGREGCARGHNLRRHA